jgi:hypothetical protein
MTVRSSAAVFAGTPQPQAVRSRLSLCGLMDLSRDASGMSTRPFCWKSTAHARLLSRRLERTRARVSWSLMPTRRLSCPRGPGYPASSSSTNSNSSNSSSSSVIRTAPWCAESRRMYRKKTCGMAVTYPGFSFTYSNRPNTGHRVRGALVYWRHLFGCICFCLGPQVMLRFDMNCGHGCVQRADVDCPSHCLAAQASALGQVGSASQHSARH